MLLAAGCPALDVGQPIVLEPGDDWTPNEVETVRTAAECWNLQFGTRLVMPGEVGWSQHVDLGFSDFVCAFALAQTNPTLPVSVEICPPGHYFGWSEKHSQRLLFETVLHELGHVLNIRRHADDPLAVMASGKVKKDLSQLVPARFAAEDRQLFHEANGELGQACEVVVNRENIPPSCSCAP